MSVGAEGANLHPNGRDAHHRQPARAHARARHAWGSASLAREPEISELGGALSRRDGLRAAAE